MLVPSGDRRCHAWLTLKNENGTASPFENNDPNEAVVVRMFSYAVKVLQAFPPPVIPLRTGLSERMLAPSV